MKISTITRADWGTPMRQIASRLAVVVAVLIVAAEMTYQAGFATARFIHWLNDHISGIASGRIAWRPIVADTVQWAHSILSTPAPRMQPSESKAGSISIQKLAANGESRTGSISIQRPSLDSLTVKQLRMLAREAGFTALARSGRRADLLEALS